MHLRRMFFFFFLLLLNGMFSICMLGTISLKHYWFSVWWFLHCWKWDVEVTCYYYIACCLFLFNSVNICFIYLVPLHMYLFKKPLNDLTPALYCNLLVSCDVFHWESILSEIRIAILVFWLLFALNIYIFNPFTFNLGVTLKLNEGSLL